MKENLKLIGEFFTVWFDYLLTYGSENPVTSVLFLTLFVVNVKIGLAALVGFIIYTSREGK